jgi:hypothetical protein
MLTRLILPCASTLRARREDADDPQTAFVGRPNQCDPDGQRPGRPRIQARSSSGEDAWQAARVHRERVGKAGAILAGAWQAQKLPSHDPRRTSSLLNQQLAHVLCCPERVLRRMARRDQGVIPRSLPPPQTSWVEPPQANLGPGFSAPLRRLWRHEGRARHCPPRLR